MPYCLFWSSFVLFSLPFCTGFHYQQWEGLRGTVWGRWGYTQRCCLSEWDGYSDCYSFCFFEGIFVTKISWLKIKLPFSAAWHGLTFQEFPYVRYRAAKSLDATTMTTFRDLIPTKLAAGVWDCLMKYKKIKDFPQTETCELLILDRSIDQVSRCMCWL